MMPGRDLLDLEQLQQPDDSAPIQGAVPAQAMVEHGADPRRGDPGADAWLRQSMAKQEGRDHVAALVRISPGPRFEGSIELGDRLRILEPARIPDR